MSNSIFSATVRSFFVCFAAVMGILLGMFVLIIAIGAASGSSDTSPQISYKYSPEILPNGNGVRKILSSSSPVILTIDIKGVIGLDGLTQEKIAQQLIESREGDFTGDRVKAILLDIDTPGGTSSDADAIYRAIKAYKETHNTPVYAFIDGYCASGGVYIASAADKIYSTEASLIGSVGVIMSSALNFSQLMDKIGVQSLTLYEGKGKDNLNPLRPWVKGEEDNIKDAIDYFYQLFVNIVTQNRPNLSKQKLIDVYGANVYPATLAKEYGYIDESGVSRQETLKQLTAAIGEEDDQVQVVRMESTNWLSELFKTSNPLLQGKITHQVDIPLEMRFGSHPQVLYLYR